MLTNEEKQFIKNNYIDMNYRQLACILGIKYSHVASYIRINLPVKNKKISDAMRVKSDKELLLTREGYNLAKIKSNLEYCLMKIKETEHLLEGALK